MKKIFYIIALLFPFGLMAQSVTNTNGEGQNFNASKGFTVDTLNRGGHQFFTDTAGRNSIPFISVSITRRRAGMWVTTANNSGSDGVVTTWYLKTLSASNGSNWGVVSFGAAYTANNGIKLNGLNFVTDSTFSPTWQSQNISNVAGTYRELKFLTNGSLRWDLYTGPETESGTAIGSNLHLTGYNNSGTGQYEVFNVNRNTGVFTIGVGLSLPTLTTGTSGDSVLVKSNGRIKSILQSSSGGVSSVSGTTNRITSTGGTTPIIDISSTFEALLGKVANPLSQFASTTSAQLATILSDKSGTGFVAYTNSPTFITPALGTPSALVGTNITGTAPGLTAGTVTTNAALLGDVTSVGNVTTYNNIVPVSKGGTGTANPSVIGEIPSGSINTSNTTFTLAHAPTTGTVQVYRNGLLQVFTVDYTRSGTTITWAYPPTTGDTLYANYNY